MMMGRIIIDTPESLYNKLVGQGTFVCYFEYFAIYSLYRECLCY